MELHDTLFRQRKRHDLNDRRTQASSSYLAFSPLTFALRTAFIKLLSLGEQQRNKYYEFEASCVDKHGIQASLARRLRGRRARSLSPRVHADSQASGLAASHGSKEQGRTHGARLPLPEHALARICG